MSVKKSLSPPGSGRMTILKTVCCVAVALISVEIAITSILSTFFHLFRSFTGNKLKYRNFQ